MHKLHRIISVTVGVILLIFAFLIIIFASNKLIINGLEFEDFRDLQYIVHLIIGFYAIHFAINLFQIKKTKPEVEDEDEDVLDDEFSSK
ncbi:MAG: divalent metal cation (Fe/Co/Zn/Cd) transporter [Bacteroidia bacterium]|jgi:divalent metal cation (Fe/Co/Zn/Cd) transporter